MQAAVGLIANVTSAIKGFNESKTGLGSFVKQAGTLGQELSFARQGIGTFGDALKGLSSVTLTAMNPLSTLTTGVGLMTGQIQTMIGSVSGLGAAVAPFVEAANPAYVKLFTLATQDLTATFGHALVPVLQTGTQIVRSFADVMAELAPPMLRLTHAVFDPLTRVVPQLANAMTPIIEVFGTLADFMTDGLGPVFAEFADVMGGLARELVPPLTLLSQALGIHLVASVSVLALALTGLAKAAELGLKPINALLHELGFTVSARDVSGKSLGAGVRNVGTSGVEDFYKTVMQEAFALGSGPSAEPPEVRSANYLQQIKDGIAGLPDELRRVVADAVAALISAVEGAARGVGVGPIKSTIAGAVSDLTPAILRGR
ncbi:MAG: hypothetical protein K2V38_09520 [Gemmataceae bacterium]|nr:hypothetical protein [Gemmataceae bacterium]